MYGVDTNVLVRIIVDDDAEQHEIAWRFFERETAAAGVFISDIVLCELVWVLRLSYAFSKSEIVDALRHIAHTRGVYLSDSRHVRRAIQRYERAGADLSDFLIGEHALARGCECVATFDRKLHRHPEFCPP